jgi:chromosome segregation ATPase
MRKALGLDGTTLRLKPATGRADQGHRPAEHSTVRHRRRFVQDGDVPVTVMRRDPVAEPSFNHRQQAEAQLAAETAARVQAERALAKAQSQARDLQTKFGHIELAKTEALEAVRQQRETITDLRSKAAQQAALRDEAKERVWQAGQAVAGLQDRLETERTARKAAEKALRLAEEARGAAERLARDLAKASPVHRGRAAKADTKPEAKPVKWWLASAVTTNRSRRH